MYTFPQTKCKTQRNKQDSKVLRHSYLDSGNEFVVETVYQNDIVSVVFNISFAMRFRSYERICTNLTRSISNMI